MTSTTGRTAIARRPKFWIAAIVATFAITAGQQAAAPPRAGAFITDCWEWGCEDGPGSGDEGDQGSDDGSSGQDWGQADDPWPEDPYGTDDPQPEDPYGTGDSQPVDPYSGADDPQPQDPYVDADGLPLDEHGNIDYGQAGKEGAGEMGQDPNHGWGQPSAGSPQDPYVDADGLPLDEHGNIDYGRAANEGLDLLRPPRADRTTQNGRQDSHNGNRSSRPGDGARGRSKRRAKARGPRASD